MFFAMLVGCLAYIYPTLFLFTVLFIRTVNSAQYLINDIICFGMFDPFEGIKYSIYFGFAGLVSSLIESLLNYLLMKPDYFMN